MAEDPRRAIIDVMAKLGKETQLHLDERHRHFKITDLVIFSVSFLLVVLAVFNVYYVRVLYNDLDLTVENMDSMHKTLMAVDDDMSAIAQSVESFDGHIQHMSPINDSIISLSGIMPNMRNNMDKIKADMGFIHNDMGLMGNAMGYIDQRIVHMKNSLPVMRENMRMMANPMGVMNPMMP